MNYHPQYPAASPMTRPHPAADWRRLLRTWFVMMLALILTACASVRQEPLPAGLTEQPPAGWSDRQQTLTALTHWQLEGKLAVRQPGQNASAVINRWQQQREKYDISLSSSFLGIGRTELSGTPGFIEIRMANGDEFRSADPDSLITTATGWDLPIDSLVWWVRGMPNPGGDYRLLFDAGNDTLAEIRQQGWSIRYERWQGFIEGKPDLPARLTARKGDHLVRLVISRWQPL